MILEASTDIAFHYRLSAQLSDSFQKDEIRHTRGIACKAFLWHGSELLRLIGTDSWRVQRIMAGSVFGLDLGR